jgi:hypothetical protein
MSGATAAHASYNGSGTQGLAVTNKINDTGDIMSVFWTKDKTTKQLLYGSSLIEIPASGNGETPGANIIFTLNSDMDCIGDLYLQISLTSSQSYTITKEYGLLNLIERVEFQCGTQIWQTLEFADILALNTTELTEGAYEKFILGLHGFNDDVGGVFAGAGGSALNVAAAATRIFSLRLPVFTRSLAPVLNNYTNTSESGFLTAAAPNQTVKIKIFTNRLAAMETNGMIDVNAAATNTMDIRLWGKHMIMCNEEREKIRNIPGGLAKRLKLTQYRDQVGGFTVRSNVINTEIDCDNFSLYGSHLIVQLFDSTLFTSATATITECCTLIDADLRLNSTSFCGKLTGGMLSGPIPESLGLYVNSFVSRTNPHTRTIVYVFPLANKAFSGSGVPLNRFDNVRLALNIFQPTGVTLNRVTITCVGETTALYKQGAASISMY